MRINILHFQFLFTPAVSCLRRGVNNLMTPVLLRNVLLAALLMAPIIQHARSIETMSADERACSTAYDALLLDLFSDSNAITTVDTPMSTTALAVCDDAFADFQADLDAFDALFESSEQDERLFLHIDAAMSNEQGDGIGISGRYTSDDEFSNSYSTTNSTSDGGGGADADVAAVAKKPKCAPGGNAVRKRQREEIHALRESAELLQKELRTLKAIAIALPPQTSSTSTCEGERRGLDSLAPDQKMPKVCPPFSQQKRTPKGALSSPAQRPIEMLLVKERQARQLAELKNSQLSKLVSEHLTVTQRFEKALFKQNPLLVSTLQPTCCICFTIFIATTLTA